MLWPTARLFLNFLIIFSFCWWFLLDLFPHYSLPIVSLSCSFLLSALCSPQRFAVGSREDSMLGYVFVFHLLVIRGLKSLASSYGDRMEFVQFCSLSFFFFEKLEESNLHIQPWLSYLSISWDTDTKKMRSKYDDGHHHPKEDPAFG